jgi:hypothetical protein
VHDRILAVITMSNVDTTIDYMDQASFLGLRALGHAPVIQWTWIYRRDVDLDGLRRFHHNLGRGLLGRRIERSPLPFGRHRWITCRGPADIAIASESRSNRDVQAWLDEQAALPIDPEHGPSWRLALQPLIEGGAVVTLVASHTVVDGVGLVIAVTEAATGITRDLAYPAAGSRTKRQALLEDSRAVVRDVPGMAKSLMSTVKMAGKNRADIVSKKPRATSAAVEPTRTVIVPAVTVHVDIGQWDERAASLGGTANSLSLGFAARLGYRLGWVAEDGSVTISVPVNERLPEDNRGNALTAVTLIADPHTVATDLAGVRSGLKTALTDLADTRNELLAALPLTPLVPRSAARRVEGLVLKSKVIGSSHVGDLDPAANRPDGTDADSFAARMAEHITSDHLRRVGGIFFPLVAGRVHGEVWVSIGFCNADGTTTREQLTEVAVLVLADFGMTGTVE